MKRATIVHFRQVDIGRHRVSRRFASAWLLLALLLLEVHSWANAQPGKLARTQAQAEHEHVIVASLEEQLYFALNLARRFGHFQHLEAAAPRVHGQLLATLAVDPYSTDETAHLTKARREIEVYLAAVNRTPETLSSHYPRIEKALESLKLVHLALERRGGDGM